MRQRGHVSACKKRAAQHHYYELSNQRVRAVKALAGSSTPPWSAASSPTPQTWAKSTETPAGTGTSTVGATAPDEPSCGSGQPCPPWSTCVSWAGHFSCRCVLGFYLSRTMGCVPARTFPGRLSLRATGPAPPSPLPPADLRRVVTQLESLFQPILGQLDAYLSSSVLDLQPHSQAVTVLHSFSALSSVTARQVDGAIAGFWERCQASDPACSFLRDTVSYQSLSLCELQPCDPVSTACVFQDGLAQCPCRPGYHPVPANGRACAAFLLVLVGVSCAGGVVLLLLLTALLLLGRAKALAQGPSLAEPVVPPFQPQQLSLPRVRPPRPLEEVEIQELGRGDRLSLGAGRVLAAGPRMKTFRGSQSSPSSAPRPGGGQSNLVFVSDEEWGHRNC
ncbi:protein HEG-like isoform X6 [Gopherus flavomarginatus]|uniref:protein HEG-like isoform X6 n=1 Tax=Gopherus flavomarginatus TaxID=286002 RepID=UPI0021CBC235|nr:protein HEG-like isoform X6 [Gopherus flavomarginatus]